MGSIRKRGSTYTVYWDLPTHGDGRRRQASQGGFPTRPLAEEYLAQLMKERYKPGLTHIGINTRKPQKWRFVDLETGEVWRWLPGGHNGRFERDRTATVTIKKK